MARRKNLRMTLRDEEILTDLYFTRILSTQQIARRYFNTFGTAKRRLYDRDIVK